MIPILFNYDATSFTTHGIGDLMETISCESVVNSDGEYELTLEYPADGEMISSLLINNIIVAKVNDHGSWQAFRIYGIEKAVNRKVTVHAQHLSYDLAGVVVKNFETTVCSVAMAKLKTNAIGSDADLFNFYTDIPNSTKPLNQDREFKMEEPKCLRAALLDGDDSIYGCWEGDLVFDNYTIKFLKPGSTDADAGQDRGVLIEYGIDLIDMDQEENISEMITGVYPYWKGREEKDDEEDPGEQEEFFVYGDVQYATGTFKRQRIVPLNVTEYYPNNKKAPTKAEIEQTARDWMTENKVGEPVINLTLSYAQLGKDVRLYDAITVRFVKIGIDVKSKVISYTYDVLKERCVEVEVGNTKPSLLFSLEDASRLKRGLIPPTRIQNNSIDSDKLANASVGSGQLKERVVSNWHIVDDAIQERNLDTDSVTTDAIKDGAVVTTTIVDGAVTGRKVADLAISTSKVASEAITETKIGNAAVTSRVIDNYHISSKLADGAVVSATIAHGEIDTLHLGDFAITYQELSEPGWHWNPHVTKIDNGDGTYYWEGAMEYDEASVRSDKIMAAAIGTGKLATNAVTTDKIANGAVDTDQIAGEAVGSAEIKERGIASVNIGTEEVGYIHLIEDINGDLAAIWEIDALVADYAYVESLVTSHIWSSGAVSCDLLVCDGESFAPRTITVRNAAGTGYTSVRGMFELLE